MNENIALSIYQVLIVLLVVHPILLFFFAEIRDVAHEAAHENEAKKNTTLPWSSRQRHANVSSFPS